MSILPKSDPILDTLNNKTTKLLPRGYLGLSAIGEPCHRKLQYGHYWAYTREISARMNRLFNVGHKAEDDMIKDLERCGITVTERQESIIATAGHWRGHTDGCGDDGESTFLIEFKTHNDASFKSMQKKGVRESKPMHYAQMTAYMGYLSHKKGLYMALNKNTSEYYIEWVDFDDKYFKDLKRKEFEILASDQLLPKVGTGNKNWYECRFCEAKDVCHNGKEVERNCRTCKFCDVEDGGVWSCAIQDKDLESSDQRLACNRYEKDSMFT